METVALMLMLWISNHTGYNTEQITLPNIIEMTPKEITTEAYTDVPNKIPEGGIDKRVNALYSYEDGPNGTIYLIAAELTAAAEDFSDPLDNPIFQERLLHELIHHSQRLSGAISKMPCRNFGEKEAYLLGGKFLKSQYVTDPMPNRNFWAHIYSRC